MTIRERLRRAKAAARRAGRMDLLSRLRGSTGRQSEPRRPDVTPETALLIADVQAMQRAVRGTQPRGERPDPSPSTGSLIAEARAMQHAVRRDAKLRTASQAARGPEGRPLAAPARAERLLQAANNLCREATRAGRRDVYSDETTVLVAMGQLLRTDWGLAVHGWNGQLQGTAKHRADKTRTYLRENWLELERRADELARVGQPLSDGNYLTLNRSR